MTCSSAARGESRRSACEGNTPRAFHHAAPGLFAVFVFAVCATAAAQPQADLGEAPRRFEPQDALTWVGVPKAAITRDTVAALYRGTYIPGGAVALNWTGSIASCDPGATNIDHQQAVIGRVNYFRALVGLPPVAPPPLVPLFGDPTNDLVQAAPLMMSANKSLSHTPPPTWLCYSSAGAMGASMANLALGFQGVDAIDEYMDDFGSNNAAVGHRRWVLFPPRAAMSTGDIPVGDAPPRLAANALYVFGPTTIRPSTPSGIAWPPAGFLPYQNLPHFSNRWSLSFPGADFSGATVAMSGPGGAIPVVLASLENGYGDNTIVFEPTGVSYAKPTADTTYDITVSGMTGANVPMAIHYQVTVIDPDTTRVPVANYQGLWWNSPAGSESGWGINFAHQGDIIFATWFTYDANGKAWWLFMTASKSSPNIYEGELIQTHGPAFSATPFDPNAVTHAAVGMGTLTFSNANTARFDYTVNGIAQSKTLTRELFGVAPTCGFGAEPNLALAMNYQDLWWAAPSGSEPGWGINLVEQSDVIFGTWFTYDVDGAPLWLSVTANSTTPGVFAGALMKTSGPPFSAVPFDSSKVMHTRVGSATFTFQDGAHATFTYTVGNVSQVRSITREVFVHPGTYCD